MSDDQDEFRRGLQRQADSLRAERDQFAPEVNGWKYADYDLRQVLALLDIWDRMPDERPHLMRVLTDSTTNDTP